MIAFRINARIAPWIADVAFGGMSPRLIAPRCRQPDARGKRGTTSNSHPRSFVHRRQSQKQLCAAVAARLCPRLWKCQRVDR